MYVCTYMCIYVCMYMCVCVCMYVCPKNVCICVCACVHRRARRSTVLICFVSVCVCVSEWVGGWVCLCLCVCVCVCVCVCGADEMQGLKHKARICCCLCFYNLTFSIEAWFVNDTIFWSVKISSTVLKTILRGQKQTCFALYTHAQCSCFVTCSAHTLCSCAMHLRVYTSVLSVFLSRAFCVAAVPVYNYLAWQEQIYRWAGKKISTWVEFHVTLKSDRTSPNE
jgi:hypothetical protein